MSKTLQLPLFSFFFFPSYLRLLMSLIAMLSLDTDLHIFSTLQLFLGIIICMMSLHMYFAPPNVLVDMPLAVKSDEEMKLIEVSVDRRTQSWFHITIKILDTIQLFW